MILQGHLGDALTCIFLHFFLSLTENFISDILKDIMTKMAEGLLRYVALLNCLHICKGHTFSLTFTPGMRYF